MSPSICSLSITSSGRINSLFPWSHPPVVFPLCHSTCQAAKEHFEAKPSSAALTERVSVGDVGKLEFSFMKNVPPRWKTILLLNFVTNAWRTGNSDRICLQRVKSSLTCGSGGGDGCPMTRWLPVQIHLHPSGQCDSLL